MVGEDGALVLAHAAAQVCKNVLTPLAAAELFGIGDATVAQSKCCAGPISANLPGSAHYELLSALSSIKSTFVFDVASRFGPCRRESVR